MTASIKTSLSLTRISYIV